MARKLVFEGPEWMGMIRWGGLALAVAGVLLIPFVGIVLATGQVMPVPAQQILEEPLIPEVAFVLATFGEILLLPGFVALFLALSRDDRAPMMFALAFVMISVPLFVASRMQLFAAAQLGERFVAATDPAGREIWLAAAALSVEVQNMNSTAALLLLCAASVITGLVMLRSGFSKWIGGMAIVAGVLSVFSPFAVMLGVPLVLPFIGLVLGAVWQMAAGLRLFRQPG